MVSTFVNIPSSLCISELGNMIRLLNSTSREKEKSIFLYLIAYIIRQQWTLKQQQDLQENSIHQCPSALLDMPHFYLWATNM